MLKPIITVIVFVLVCNYLIAGQEQQEQPVYHNDSAVTSFERMAYPYLADSARIIAVP